jgi:VWFA-related protein
MAVRRFAAVALLVAVTAVAGTELGGQTIGQRAPAFKASTELVLVNVVVRDRTGAIVRGLTKDDFTIIEDGKLQTIQTFDAEDLGTSPDVAALDAVKVLGGALKAVPSPSGPAASGASSPAEPAPDLRGRRLVVLFFDLSSMQTEELERAVVAARDYLTKQLSAVDLVAIASFSTALRVDQDFTADREALLNALNRFNTAGGQGFEEGATGDSEGTPDTGAPFTVDDTEFNIFNTDRRLQALQTLSEALSGIDQKKSIV